jgi:Spy/CpxP family protein refolding chaperone
MRKSAVILFTALAFAACDKEATGPSSDLAMLDDAAELAFSSSFVTDPGSTFLAFVHRFPDELRLTADQQAKIKALVEAFLTATRADHESLAAILKQAHEAAQAGKSREEVRAILEQGLPIRERLQAAEAELRTDILAVLTPQQRAWLDAHQPRPCTAAQLTDVQKAEISGLVAAFELTNRADIEAIRAAFEQARAAHQNGASREEISAILEAVRPAMQRVRAAEAALAVAISNVLTAEQKASGCYRFHRT